jgi:lipopolysaccharide biosynthesis glycosyltransferase
MKKGKINITCSTDDNYAPYACVMLVSVLENLNKDCFANIFILDGGISVENKNKIKSTLKKYNCDVSFVFVPKEKEKLFESATATSSHLSKTAYYRLLLPEMLNNIDKIIYLDCDLIVLDDISDLWDIDLEGKQIMAVPVLFMFYYYLLSDRFNISPESGFLNSGVMVMDLKSLRNSNFVNKAIEFIKNNHSRLTNALDQDLFNVMFLGSYKKIDLIWNQTIESYIGRGFKNTSVHHYDLYTKEEFEASKKDPKIAHFDGALKPWHRGLIHPHKKMYDKYLKKTEFKDLKKKFNFRRMINFYIYYGLKILPKFLYQLILPLLKKIYYGKNK